MKKKSKDKGFLFFIILITILIIIGGLNVLILILSFVLSISIIILILNFIDSIKKFLNINLDANKQKTVKIVEKESVKINPEIYSEPIILRSTSQNKLEKRQKYLHIALNNNLTEAKNIISEIPDSRRILIEVGTPLIKTYGIKAIEEIKNYAPNNYIIADNKCVDLAPREVEMFALAGANASTCMGIAPVETINSFIKECQKYNIDSIIDMMNVPNPLLVLKKLKTAPNIVMLHRGVDETHFSKEKQIPYYQIKQIKGSYNVFIAVAGGDTIQEIRRAVFNDADIVVVWKSFYKSTKNISKVANLFLDEIK
jgi:3-keto-L-gulonate-6-phosphate decarboxylase